jgi:hypothetical protein
VRAAADAVDGGAHIRAVVQFVLADIGPRLPYFVRQAGDGQSRKLAARIQKQRQRTPKTKPARRA